MVAREQSIKQPILHTGCAQPYVAISTQVTLANFCKLDGVVSELTNWLTHQSITIAGPLFYRYRIAGNINKPCSLEVGYPVSQIVKGDDKIMAGTIPGGTFATLVHCGSIADINSTYAILNSWADEQNACFKTYRSGEDVLWAGRFEFHLSHPAGQLNTAECRTAVALLLA